MINSSLVEKVGEAIFLIFLLYIAGVQLILLGIPALIIGLLIGFAGLDFVTSRINKFQLLISEKYYSYLNNDAWLIRCFLIIPFSIANRSFQLADKIQNTILRSGVKFALVIDIIYLIVVVAMVVIIMWIIISLLGGSLSGGSTGVGGGSSSSSGISSSSSSSSGAIFGSSYEQTAKEESRSFKADKETRSSESALPFGLGDTIYKTEYEDASTGETVKGHGWTRSEADSNARKNLREK